MPAELTLCFIDDSLFERELFLDIFPPAAPDWELLAVESFAQAREALSGQQRQAQPILFLLDLWGNDPTKMSQPRLIPQAEMEAQATGIIGLEEVYGGLEELEGDRLNEFLKRFYTILTGWRALFGRAAIAADQTLAFGLYNLAQVRKHYPIAAAVAYTRKSSAEDICAFLAAGGDGAMMKPHGPTEEAIRAATRSQAPELVEYLKGFPHNAD